jgi:hypothetical protein
MDNVDGLLNLQLLEGVPNQEKSDREFSDWLTGNCACSEARVDYLKRHFIPETDVSLSNFSEFFEQRKAKLSQELHRILDVT